MKSLEEAESDILDTLNERQELTFNELKSVAIAGGIDDETLVKSLKELENANALASRSSGGIKTYYMLQEKQVLRRIMVVEDEKNINLLMTKSIGKEFDISQVYDGSEALRRIRFEKPDLIILDLMLPGVDGLEICQQIKRDQNLRETIVIIVSAMDATTNRFKGIQYGADYYIKKPFDPSELRSLVTIFLKKKGKKFDPLIDLPNEEKISDAVEKALKSKEKDYEIGRLHVDGLARFAEKYGNASAITVLRLVSQLLQDKIIEVQPKQAVENSIFVGFLNGDDFVIAGDGRSVGRVASGIQNEFNAVLPFIYQNEGYKPIELGIEDIYGAEKPKLALEYTAIEKRALIERREEVRKNKEDVEEAKDTGTYTYEELRHMLGSEGLDITITRDPDGGVRFSVGKGSKPGEEK